MESLTVTSASELDGAHTAVSMVAVSMPNQPVQVQSVIHQQSVIQAAGGTINAIQVTPVAEDGEDLSDSKKRREILNRRPSYRRILNDLDPSVNISVAKIEEESNSDEEDDDEVLVTSSGAHQLHYQQAAVLPAHTLQLAGGDSSASGLQTLTMTNVNSGNVGNAQGGATIVQYAQGPDGQIYIPGNVQAYQIATPTSLPQGVVMQTGGGLGSGNVAEEASRKRELRLLKNREAAKECRRKKKEYVKCLENRVAVLENQNKALIEELKSLKELYCQKEG